MTTARAQWQPGWYELDQDLEVGRAAEFAFFPPASASAESLVFYNTLWNPAKAVAARGTVRRITHPSLGEIQRVDTEGLDYTFELANGTKLVVNAEEHPGLVCEERDGKWVVADMQIVSWVLDVELDDLGPLKPAPVRLGSS